MNQNLTDAAPKLEVFISYASEDAGLAIALHKALAEHLGSDFAHVWIDREGIRAGLDLNSQIREQLDQTDILVVVFTGQPKESHSFTGLEIGYFLYRATAPGSLVRRRIVTFYLEHPPATISGVKGLSYGISRADLAKTRDDFERSLVITDTDEMPVFFRDMETAVDEFRKIARLGPSSNDSIRRLGSVKSLLLDSFDVLKTRKDTEVNPQKKIILEVFDTLTPECMEIPASTLVIPEGSGAMAIFGMADEKISWSEFLSKAPDRYRALWKDTLERVVISSLDRLEADNSQMIMSFNNEDLYRVILSSRIRYYNGRREFHLFFVEVLRRNDLGDERTTRLLKGLALCCRFRFMFFEDLSEFSARNLSLRSIDDARERARRLIRELNLLLRESTEAKLDDPVIWADLIRDWTAMAEMHHSYQPIEERIRECAAALITAADRAEANCAKLALVNAISELEGGFIKNNAAVIMTLANQIAATAQTTE